MVQAGNTSSHGSHLTGAITKLKPTVVVGLDFGTTFSGFAFVSQPERIHKFYEWPSLAAAGGKSYCKTPTSLLYKRVNGDCGADSYVLENWGYAAVVKHANYLWQSKYLKQPHVQHIIPGPGPRNDNNSRQGTSNAYHLVKRFKLLLAGAVIAKLCYHTPSLYPEAVVKLPNGLSARKTISDYLRKLSELILSVVQNTLGSNIAAKDIRWCLPVPAIWDDGAKEELKTCAQLAGLIQGEHCFDQEASPHQLIIVLEPEAASLSCQQSAGLLFNNGDRFLMVDVGEETVDLELHEKDSDLKVREVSTSSGGLCGWAYVERGFVQFLSRKIECFPKFCVDQPHTVLQLKKVWDLTIKHTFDGSNMYFPYELELPAKLARAWEATAKTNGDIDFDMITLSLDDMLEIFDPIIDKILKLIERKLIEGVKAIMVVGDFSTSPYLMKRIRQAFSERVETIVNPHDPEVICCGAVLYGIRFPS